MDPELDIAADVANDDLRGTQPDAGWADSPGAPRLSQERVALGRALEARAGEIGRMVDQQFAEDLRGNAFGTARLGAELIGRWLATDEAASDDDLALMASQGEQAIVENAVLASVAKAYFSWRDTTIAVLTEEARRLQVSDDLLMLASNVVRLSSDGSLVRIIREFDEARRALQARLDAEQVALADRALHDQLTGLPNRT
ncbi:MAG TPA: hypothetical protein VGY51_12290, partial [Acidimicrobiales bacterium]|nr:hypothetical protein [Acidimicrobiales bacterium]